MFKLIKCGDKNIVSVNKRLDLGAFSTGPSYHVRD